ncbi:hypothetical protein C8Q70DRAFT_625662 [Cubamyces menziesii]|nr:hypothetical protein C8Q70DRAFT_625662 [Cubamyces menziesii]
MLGMEWCPYVSELFYLLIGSLDHPGQCRSAVPDCDVVHYLPIPMLAACGDHRTEHGAHLTIQTAVSSLQRQDTLRRSERPSSTPIASLRCDYQTNILVAQVGRPVSNPPVPGEDQHATCPHGRYWSE